MFRFNRFYRFILAVLFLALAGYAGAAFEQLCENWENIKVGDQAGDSIDRDGASVTPPQVTDKLTCGGRQAVCFDFTFKPDPQAKTMEAEKARLEGVGRYHDALASGGDAVSGLGNTAGSAITFEKVAPADALTVYYNQTLPHGWRAGAPARTTQCGLYDDGKRIATLKFVDPGGWFTPYNTVVYEGKVRGTVRLQVDPEDFVINKGPCCNVDKVVFGPPRLQPSIQIRLKLGDVNLEPAMAWFNCAIRAPRGFVYQIGLEDGTAVQHWSRPIPHPGNNDWEHITVSFNEFRPQIQIDKVKALKAVLLRASGDEAGLKGTIAIDEARFAKGWPSSPPRGIPFQNSTAFAGVSFTSRFKCYAGADRWFPSWAADGQLYSPYSDGSLDNIRSNTLSTEATTGMARIEGDDPLNLKLSSLGVFMSRPWPYSGRYPCASLIYNGIWYYGTAITNSSGPDGSGMCQGPFVGFRISRDFGKTWIESPHTPLNNLFQEQVDLANGGLSRIKMGTPHFVDFGKNMEHSPDGKAYLVAQGSTRPASPQTWVRGDEVYLARVQPQPETINNRDKYEFFAGYNPRGEPLWTNKFSEIKPMITWQDRAGSVSITYDAPLRKYLMCLANGENNKTPFDTCILESDRVTGPWKLVTYMEQFGKQAYDVNIPSKFISADGRTMWLCYSANWAGYPQNPRGSTYGMSLHELKLMVEETPPAKPAK